jgi:hypothetical protein
MGGGLAAWHSKITVHPFAVETNAFAVACVKLLKFPLNKQSQGVLALCVICASLVAHTGFALWFLAHSVVVEGEFLRRKDFSFMGKRHGVTHGEVRFVDQHGADKIKEVRWNISRPPKTKHVSIRCASSGFVKYGPATLLDIFWLEVSALGLAGLIAALIGAAVAASKIARIRR